MNGDRFRARCGGPESWVCRSLPRCLPVRDKRARMEPPWVGWIGKVLRSDLPWAIRAGAAHASIFVLDSEWQP
jgi:hypothetical protein